MRMAPATRPAAAPRTPRLRALSAMSRPTDLACVATSRPSCLGTSRPTFLISRATSAACAMARPDTLAARNADSVSRKESHLSAGMPRPRSDGA
ncbi:hypothetical protein DL769_006763 [Monosporascus sp. CRB-8-3]|nr:hypothetical protein DL769_006763 [Monosporascus sp. CRB-8-3]